MFRHAVLRRLCLVSDVPKFPAAGAQCLACAFQCDTPAQCAGRQCGGRKWGTLWGNCEVLTTLLWSLTMTSRLFSGTTKDGNLGPRSIMWKFLCWRVWCVTPATSALSPLQHTMAGADLTDVLTRATISLAIAFAGTSTSCETQCCSS